MWTSTATALTSRCWHVTLHVGRGPRPHPGAPNPHSAPSSLPQGQDSSIGSRQLLGLGQPGLRAGPHLPGPCPEPQASVPAGPSRSPGLPEAQGLIAVGCKVGSGLCPPQVCLPAVHLSTDSLLPGGQPPGVGGTGTESPRLNPGAQLRAWKSTFSFYRVVLFPSLPTSSGGLP